jgi:hypothetical protein
VSNQPAIRAVIPQFDSFDNWENIGSGGVMEESFRGYSDLLTALDHNDVCGADEATGAEAKPVAEYAGFTARDVPLLLKKAESDAGAGDYAASRREYDIILHLEPGNLAARTGMSRVNLSVDRK